MTTYPREAGEVLEQLARLRGQTRVATERIWLPLLVFGTVTALGALVFLGPGRQWVAPYWWVVGAVCIVAIAAANRRRSRRVGIADRPWRYVLALGLFAAALAGGIIGGRYGERPGVVVPFAMTAVGYIILARTYGDRFSTTAVTITGAIGVILACTAPSWLSQVGLGAAMITSGVIIRQRAKRREVSA